LEASPLFNSPVVYLSLKGEGEENNEERLTPLLNTPLSYFKGLVPLAYTPVIVISWQRLYNETRKQI